MLFYLLLFLEGMTSIKQGFLLFTATVVILIAVIQLMLKIFQLFTLKIHYLLNWMNWLEVGLFSCAIVFVFVYRSDCYCHTRWQWQFGCISVFLAWIALILFIEKLPYAGTIISQGCNSILQRFFFCKFVGSTIFTQKQSVVWLYNKPFMKHQKLVIEVAMNIACYIFPRTALRIMHSYYALLLHLA